MRPIYKICPASLWREAEEAGVFRGAPVDLADGFIHFSTADQLAETAAKHFAGQNDLLLLAVDPGRIADGLRWEPSRGGALFPHFYGELPLAAVAQVHPFPIGPEGRHVPPPGLNGEPGVGAGTFDPSAQGWARRETDRFIGLVGPLWVKEDGGGERVAFLAERRHLNRGGVVHGGMLMTFADQALGLAAWADSGQRPQATVQLDTHFISGVKEGEFVEARCRVLRRTRSLIFMSGELVVAGRTVAASNGVWKMRAAGEP